MMFLFYVNFSVIPRTDGRIEVRWNKIRNGRGRVRGFSSATPKEEMFKSEVVKRQSVSFDLIELKRELVSVVIHNHRRSFITFVILA